MDYVIYLNLFIHVTLRNVYSYCDTLKLNIIPIYADRFVYVKLHKTRRSNKFLKYENNGMQPLEKNIHRNEKYILHSLSIQ